jgi:hypothetical protein
MTKPPVHLLWGEDAFLLREAAIELVSEFARQGRDGEIKAREVDAAEWQGGELADLATPSLFGERRALVVTDCRSLPREALGELAAYLAAPDPDSPLVLLARVGERARAPASLVKLVQPIGTVREIKLARKDLAGWLVKRSQARDHSSLPMARRRWSRSWARIPVSWTRPSPSSRRRTRGTAPGGTRSLGSSAALATSTCGTSATRRSAAICRRRCARSARCWTVRTTR